MIEIFHFTSNGAFFNFFFSFSSLRGAHLYAGIGVDAS